MAGLFEKEGKTRLTEVCTKSLLLVTQLLVARDLDDVNVLRRSVKELLDRFERDARDAGFEPEQVKNAEFALVALIDEAVINSNFAQRDVWIANPVQMELFNRFDAGEEFFRRLDDLRQHAQANLPVLEVYYFCLLLGFKGKYFQEPERLRHVVDDTKADVFRARPHSATETLSPNGLPRDMIKQVVTKELPLWIIGVGAAVIGFVFFLIMTFFINGEADKSASIIEQLLR